MVFCFRNPSKLFFYLLLQRYNLISLWKYGIASFITPQLFLSHASSMNDSFYGKSEFFNASFLRIFDFSSFTNYPLVYIWFIWWRFISDVLGLRRIRYQFIWTGSYKYSGLVRSTNKKRINLKSKVLEKVNLFIQYL